MLSIAQVGTVDQGGGAAAVATGLMRGYAARGHRVWHVVGRKRTDDPNVIVLPDDDRLAFQASGYTAVQRAFGWLAGHYPNRGFGKAGRTLRLLTHPRAARAQRDGIEDFEFPSSARLIERLGATPDIVHAHNLHGGYFDLRALAPLSARVPTVVTMHDMWLLTGHCGHSLACNRWTTGCGSCADLRLAPSIRRDATADNWRRKQAVYASSSLHIATPSRWLRDKVEQSMLAPAAKSLRIIPNGVDTSIFKPADRRRVRETLNLPRDIFIVMLTTGTPGSMWKDDTTLRETIHLLRERPLPFQIEFMAVGRDSALFSTAPSITRAIPFQHDPRAMARFYQAADVYLHAARADTFPLAVLEALACGTPVVATAIGGVPEEIVPVSVEAVRAGDVGKGTGVLVDARSSRQMADAVAAVLNHSSSRAQLSSNAVRDVAARFTLDRQIETYLDWYREILQ